MTNDVDRTAMQEAMRKQSRTKQRVAEYRRIVAEMRQQMLGMVQAGMGCKEIELAIAGMRRFVGREGTTAVAQVSMEANDGFARVWVYGPGPEDYVNGVVR